MPRMKLGSSDSNCHLPLLLQPTTIGPACKLPPDAEKPQATRRDVPVLVLMSVPVLMLCCADAVLGGVMPLHGRPTYLM